jgi:lipopolysaccharide export system protein LptA
MVCKFRADHMPNRFLPVIPALAAVVMAVVMAAAVPLAQAERADRSKNMVVEADQPSTVDLQRQVVVFSGNVVVTQGTMVMRAERLEMREWPDGWRTATAFGSDARPATWQQKRDGLDEIVQGSARRIEFDSRADTLRFVGNGAVRRLRGGTVADEITGALIRWDNSTEIFSVEGGAATAANPGGRVRVILSPRAEDPASAPPPPPASPALEPSRELGSRP